MNPRSGTGDGGERVAHVRPRPLFRRGMPYGPWFDDKTQDEERGLLGLFFCTDLADQFEHLLLAEADRPYVLPVTQPNRLDDQVGDHCLADRVGMDPVVDEHVLRIDSGRIDEFDAADGHRVDRCRVLAEEILGRLEAVDQRHVVLLGQTDQFGIDTADDRRHPLPPRRIGQEHTRDRRDAVIDDVAQHHLAAGRRERLQGRLDIGEHHVPVRQDV